MKKKSLILLGIAVGALLLTAPVLASTGYSKIYGNANEDDVLDMRDVTYIKLVIFGKKPATDFADANYDGKISMLDVGQAKLIILGKEKKLTLVDQVDRTVTVPRPIERVVCAGMMDPVRTTVALSAADKIVGVPYAVDRMAEVHNYLFLAHPSLEELPRVSSRSAGVNAESILSLKPDVIFAQSTIADSLQEQTAIPVVCVRTSGSLDFEIYRFVGTVIEKEREAEELISYANEKISEVTDDVLEIPENEKPRVYLAYWCYQGTITRTTSRDDPLDMAGGLNVAKEAAAGAGGYGIDVSKEQIIAWNPDIILIHRGTHQEFTIDYLVLSDPELQVVNAVKNREVYCTIGYMYGWDPLTGVCEVFYEAKLLYPDEFEDLEVEKECNEILKRFYGADGLYTHISGQLELYRWE